MIEKKIKQILKERMTYIKLREESFDEETLKYTVPMPKEVDSMAKEVEKLLKEHFKELPVDFIIETLTHLGQAPNVMYDDNGYFAVSGDGLQEVVYGRKKIEGGMTVIVNKKMWKKTIREALKYYMEN